MKTITIERQLVNITALDEALENTLADKYLGLSVHNGMVRVHLQDDTSDALVLEAETVVQLHDPTQLTANQQAEIARRQALMQARADNSGNLDVGAYDLTDPLVQQLARKLRWIEQEIRDLRDLQV